MPLLKVNQVIDSTLVSIKQMIQRSVSRALVLQIDEGQRWWSTRLFSGESTSCQFPRSSCLIKATGSTRIALQNAMSSTMSIRLSPDSHLDTND